MVNKRTPNSPGIFKRIFAKDVYVDTSNFNNVLSPAQVTLQQVLDKLDDTGYDYLGFNVDYISEGDEAVGQMYWDADDDTVSLVTNGNTYQIGQELAPIYKNQTGSNITNGTPVMFAGSVGASGRILIQPAIADGSLKSEYTVGLTTEDIANGDDGKVTWFGKVRGLDTTGTPYGEVWNDGDILYVSPTTAGYLTNVQPQAPDLTIIVAAVVYAHATNGTLMVRPTWSERLVDLNDVNGTPLVTNGQVLYWDNDRGLFDFTTDIVIDQTTGRVGIGTASPSQKLQVNGTIALKSSGGLGNLLISDNGAGTAYINNVGNGYLDIRSALETKIVSGAFSVGSLSSSSFKLGTGTNGDVIFTGSASTGILTINASNTVGGAFQFQTRGTDVLYLSKDQKIGIGTTNPISTLDIVGTINSAIRLERTGGYPIWDFNLSTQGLSIRDLNVSSITRLLIKTGGDIAAGGNAGGTSPTMYLTSTGNVGIGTINPSEQLDITGNFNLTDTTFVNPYGIIYKGNTMFMHNFNYGNNGTVTTSGRNIFIGKYAGNLTMGSTATSPEQASDNQVIGESALFLNTIGYQNQGIGNFALYNNTTGAGNVAIGHYALYNNTIGYRVVGIGNFAGRYVNGGVISNSLSKDSVYIGANTKSFASNTTNENVFGYGAEGLGDNTVVIGNDSIIKTILKGNVGIGTTSPQYPLSMSSSNQIAGMYLTSTSVGYAPNSIILAATTSSRGQGIYCYDDAKKRTWYSGVPYASIGGDDWIIGYNESTGFDASVAQNSFSIINIKGDTKYVGIGTTNPVQKLHVSGSAYINSGQLYIDSNNWLYWGNSLEGIRGTNGSGLSFRAGGTTKVFINSSGNVGIGTTSPLGRLDVSDGLYSFVLGADSNTTTRTDGVSKVARILVPHTNTADGYNTLLFSTGGFMTVGGGTSAGNAVTGIGFYTAPNDTTPVGTEAMRIAGNGNVGIGTTNPQSKLHINGTPGSLSEGLTFGDGDSGIYERIDDIFNINIAGINYWEIAQQYLGSSNPNRAIIRNAIPTTTTPVFVPSRNDLDTGIGGTGDDVVSVIAGGIEGIRIDEATNPGFVKTILNPDGAVGINTGLWFGDGDSGIYEYVDDRFFLVFGGNVYWEMASDYLGSSSTARAAFRNIAPTSTVPCILPYRNDNDTGIGRTSENVLSLISGGIEGIRIDEATNPGFVKTILNPDGAVGVNTGLWFGDGDSGIYENSDDVLRISCGGTDRWAIGGDSFTGILGGPLLRNEVPSSTNPTLMPSGSDINTGIGWSAEDQLSLIAGGVEGIRVTENTSISINMGLADSDKTYWGAGSDMSIYYDGTDGFIDTGVVNPSDLIIDCGTEKTLELEEGVYMDENFDPLIGRVGSAVPDIINLDTTNIKIVAFAGSATTEEVSSHRELNHNYQEGTDLMFHIHWAPTTAGTGNVKRQLEYYITDGNAAGVKASGILSVITAASGTAWQTTIASFGTITGTTFKIGDQISLRLYRDPNDADDTYGSDAVVKTFGYHYKVDTMGSRQLFTK